MVLRLDMDTARRLLLGPSVAAGACGVLMSSSAGSLLNRFYIENRVIERDAFRVWIVV